MKAFLTIGSMTGAWRMSWRSSFSIMLMPTQPEISTSGVPAIEALAIGVSALVKPGPAVTMATPGRRVSRP
jgi:hypothetical protein